MLILTYILYTLFCTIYFIKKILFNEHFSLNYNYVNKYIFSHLLLSIPFHFLFYYSLKSWVDRLSFSVNFDFSTACQFFNFFFFHLFLLLCFTFWKISLALIPISLAYFKFLTFFFSECSFLYCLILFHEHKIFYASEDMNYRLLKSVWSPHCLLSLSSFLFFPLLISLSVFHHRGLL